MPRGLHQLLHGDTSFPAERSVQRRRRRRRRVLSPPRAHPLAIRRRSPRCVTPPRLFIFRFSRARALFRGRSVREKFNYARARRARAYTRAGKESPEEIRSRTAHPASFYPPSPHRQNCANRRAMHRKPADGFFFWSGPASLLVSLKRRAPVLDC